MIARTKTAVESPAEPSPKPRVTLAEGVTGWLPAEAGELRIQRKAIMPIHDGIALCRSYLQGVIDAHPSGEAEGCGEIEEFADKTARRFPLTGNLLADGEHRQRARELVAAFADAWIASGEESYHWGRRDEREGA